MRPVAPGGRTVADEVRGWCVKDVTDFLRRQDLSGPASVLSGSAFNGHDLIATTEVELTQDLRLTPFAARKILRARDEYLRN